MKTKITVFLMLIAAFICGSCVGVNNLGVFDDSVPEDRRVYLEIEDLAVILYNNKPVEWFSGLTQNKISIELPPGKSVFVVKWVEVENAGTMQRFVDHTQKVELDMQPGLSYRIYRQEIWTPIGLTITSIKTEELKTKPKK